MPNYATGYDPASALTGAEELQVVQSGADKSTTAQDVANLAWTQITQAAYDALDPPVEGVMYVIVG